MTVNFKLNYLLSFVFDETLKNVFLTKNNEIVLPYLFFCKDKLNGFIIEPNINKINDVTLSKKYLEEFKIKIEPNQWRMILNLQNIHKLWQFSVYMTIIEKTKTNEKLTFYDIKNLPENCLPFLRWLIPLMIDPMIYNSNFNQIIIN